MDYISERPLKVFFKEPIPVGRAEGPTRDAGALSTLDAPRHVAQEFASLLYLEVLKAMRASISQGGLFGGDSLSREIYTSMFDVEIARLLAVRGYEGISQMVERAIDNGLATGRNPASARAAFTTSNVPLSALHPLGYAE